MKNIKVFDVEKNIDFINGYESLPDDHQLEYMPIPLD